MAAGADAAPTLPPVETLISRLFEGAWTGADPQRTFGAMTLVGRPDEAAALLSAPEGFVKNYDLLTLMGHSRFDADGSDWSDRRDLTQPLLRAAAVTRNHAGIAAEYDARLAGVEVAADLDHAILSAASGILLGAFGGRTDGARLADWLLDLRPTARLVQTVAMFGATEAEIARIEGQVARARGGIAAILAEDAALEAWTRRADAMMGGRTPDPVRHAFDSTSELIMMLLAGTETTASTLAWGLHALAADMDTQERLAAAARRSGANAIEIEVFAQEVMRYAPPVPLLTRRVTGGDRELAGRRVAEGEVLALDIVRLHHDSAFWLRPRQFRADRPEFVERRWHRRAYLPFSAGARVCGGTGLARAEIHAGFTALLRRFRVHPGQAGRALEMDYAMTLRPRDTDLLELERRDG